MDQWTGAPSVEPGSAWHGSQLKEGREVDAPLRPCDCQCNRGGSNEGQRAQHNGVGRILEGNSRCNNVFIKFMVYRGGGPGGCCASAREAGSGGRAVVDSRAGEIITMLFSGGQDTTFVGNCIIAAGRARIRGGGSLVRLTYAVKPVTDPPAVM